jgi:alkanesulfonate monooxygenase SsuD/methylene tetrahydromethanopterin reductase-like flavin-dependent oxidoreductase (luciferase family)
VTERLNGEPLTLACYAILDERGDQGRNYADALAEFQRAEQLGVEGVWVRQFHLTRGDRGGLPSPFVFLAWLAARTTRLRVGTAAVTLPLETPLRVAEDAAVLDVLSGGRLELGVANGGYQPGLPELFGRPSYAEAAERRAVYLEQFSELLRSLAGVALDDAGSRLNPPAPRLVSRVWEATLSEHSGYEAGTRGHGVLLGTTQTIPAEVTARAYYRGLDDFNARDVSRPVAPRVGLATLIYPAPNPDTALREAAAGIEAKYEWGRDFLPHASTLAEKAAALNLHYGTSEQITESILAQPGFPYATQLLVQTELFYDTYQRRTEALEQFTAEVAPNLGWHTHLTAPIAPGASSTPAASGASSTPAAPGASSTPAAPENESLTTGAFS